MMMFTLQTLVRLMLLLLAKVGYVQVNTNFYGVALLRSSKFLHLHRYFKMAIQFTVAVNALVDVVLCVYSCVSVFH